MIWQSWQVKTLRGSSSLSQPWLCRLLLGTLPRGTEATAAQHPAAHQGWASAAVWVPEFGLQWSEKMVKVTFEKQQHHQRLRAHIALPQLRWSVKLIMNLKQTLSIYIAVMIPICPKSPGINANSLCIQCLMFPATATLFTLINDHFVYY